MSKIDVKEFEEWVDLHVAMCGRLVRDESQMAPVVNLFYSELGRFTFRELESASMKVAASDAKLFCAGDHLKALKSHFPVLVNPEPVPDYWSGCQMCFGSGYVQVKVKNAHVTPGGWKYERNTVACKCNAGDHWRTRMEQPPAKKVPPGYPEVFAPDVFDSEKHESTGSVQTVTREEAETMVRDAAPLWGRMIARQFLAKQAKHNADGGECSEFDLAYLMERAK